jgi:hypothetical protein
VSGNASERPYELAYEASVRAVEDQARLLESVRSRAGTLFAATAIVTSVLGGQTLSKEPAHALHPVSYVGGAIGFFIAISLLTLAMLVPYRMRFSISAGAVLELVATSSAAQPTAVEVLREIALRYEKMYEVNAPRVRLVLLCSRLAILCILGEVAFWIASTAEGAG